MLSADKRHSGDSVTTMTKRKAVAVTAALVVPLLLAASFLFGFVYSWYDLPGSYRLRRALPTVEGERAHRGYRAGEHIMLESEPGRWGLAKDAVTSGDLTDEQRETLAKLQTIGYLAGYEAASGATGVTTYVREMAFAGVNIYSSGHAPVAVLVDMEGTVLHEWRYESPFPPIQNLQDRTEEFWRRVHLYENGDLLAIYDGIGLIKLDKDSNLLWASPCGAHHDLEVDESGSIYVLTREAKIRPHIDGNVPILEDFVATLDAHGNVVRKVSVLDAFQRSSYSSMLSNMATSGDIVHTNTLEVFDGSHANRSPLFEKGNVLISVRPLDTIAIVNLVEEKVVWALSGQWRRQHQPTLLEDGTLLLLDNLGHHGMSKVIEFDPFTQEILWAYEGNEANGFYTQTCGSNQRLPNGNTLITESDGGRAFEVTPDGKIVWEFRNPARAGENLELVATLFELVRLGPDFPTHWMRAPTDRARQ